MTASAPLVVGLGEALFDVFASGPRLGGAPLNVAVHAHQLLRGRGGAGVVVSRVGEDELGRTLRQAVVSRGMSAEAIQCDPRHPTGRVEVERTADGGHRFRIAEHAAWDHLAWGDELAGLAGGCHAVAFGTLAQRHAHSRASIQRFLEHAPQALKLFDVNLRSSAGTDFFDARTLAAGCRLADLVKLNDQELGTVCSLTGTRDAEDLRETFGLVAIIFTRGKDGTAAFTAQGLLEGEPVRFAPATDADTVGAGDACSAGLLSALVLGRPLPEALTMANRMGAYVASQPGATPQIPAELRDLLV